MADITTLLSAALQLILDGRQPRISTLQRKFRLGYNAAMKLMEELAKAGVVGPANAARVYMPNLELLTSLVFDATPLQKRVRTIRDLAHFLVEMAEEGRSYDTRSKAMLLHPLVVADADLRTCTQATLRPDSPTPITDLALALSSHPVLASPFSSEELRQPLQEDCAMMDRRFSLITDPEDVLIRAFERLVRYFDKRLFDGYGAHTRAFEAFLPDAMVPRGQGNDGGTYREHVVPCNLLRDQCNKWLRHGVPVPHVARWLRPYLAIVHITAGQADLLDQELGFKTRMPPDWAFESGCIFERLHVAGVAFDRPAGSLNNRMACRRCDEASVKVPEHPARRG